MDAGRARDKAAKKKRFQTNKEIKYDQMVENPWFSLVLVANH